MAKEVKYNLENTKSLRLSDSAMKNIAYISQLEEVKESDLLRKFINESVANYKLKLAFKAYENKSVSIYGAANIAELSYKDFIDKMVENGVKTDFGSIGEDVNTFVKLTEKKK